MPSALVCALVPKVSAPGFEQWRSTRGIVQEARRSSVPKWAPRAGNRAEKLLPAPNFGAKLMLRAPSPQHRLRLGTGEMRCAPPEFRRFKPIP